jgi:KDO2-lipid IV(A) lauroyltransferase
VEEIALGRAAMGVFRALARGRLVCLLLDQNAHRDEGVFAPFFGELALTRSAPASLAMERGVPVLPVFVFRTGSSSRHVVRVFPHLELESGRSDREGALERNVAKMNEAIERAIRLAPDHWLWPHRRFKTRPEGALPIYRRRGRPGGRS